MPTGINFSAITGRAMNDAGQISYLAKLIGTGVTSANDVALFLFDPNLGTSLIVREGDWFDVGYPEAIPLTEARLARG